MLQAHAPVGDVLRRRWSGPMVGQCRDDLTHGSHAPVMLPARTLQRDLHAAVRFCNCN